jgi:hypothetical protein
MFRSFPALLVVAAGISACFFLLGGMAVSPPTSSRGSGGVVVIGCYVFLGSLVSVGQLLLASRRAGSKRFALRACSPGLAVSIPVAGSVGLQVFQCVAVRLLFVLISRSIALRGICLPTAAPHCVPAGDRDAHTPAAGHPPGLRPWRCQRRCLFWYSDFCIGLGGKPEPFSMFMPLRQRSFPRHGHVPAGQFVTAVIANPALNACDDSLVITAQRQES